jgi:hypothetical protein
MSATRPEVRDGRGGRTTTTAIRSNFPKTLKYVFFGRVCCKSANLRALILHPRAGTRPEVQPLDGQYASHRVACGCLPHRAGAAATARTAARRKPSLGIVKRQLDSAKLMGVVRDRVVPVPFSHHAQSVCIRVRSQHSEGWRLEGDFTMHVKLYICSAASTSVRIRSRCLPALQLSMQMRSQ